jgi:putative protease
MAGQAWTVREIFVSNRKTMEAKAGSTVEVETPFSFQTGDSIYKVSSKEAFTLSENACLRRLESVQGEKVPCRLQVALGKLPPFQGEGRGGDGVAATATPHPHPSPLPEGEGTTGQYVLHITTEVSGSQYDFSYPLGALEASRSIDMAGVLRSQFAKTGETPFLLECLEAPDFPAVMIPAATFKELRRRFYRFLDERVSAAAAERLVAKRRAATLAVDSLRSTNSRSAARETLAVVMDLPRDWRFPLQQGADIIILPLSRAAIHQLPSTTPRMRGCEQQVVWQLPFMIFDRDMPLYRDTLRQLHGAGFRHFEAANLSHFGLLRGLEGLHISTWHRCFSLNSQALAAWQELGAETATLYIEDDAVNLASLLAADVAIQRRVIAYAPLPVMTTKIRIKDVHSNTPLQSDRGEAYTVTTRDGLQTITAATPFSLTARHNELRNRGCGSFLIDLRQAPREAWSEIIAAFKAGRQIPGTTEFNYATELI